MIRAEFFCTTCNVSAVRREAGDEVSTGYAVYTAANPSRAEVDIPAVPPGWTVIQGGLVCDACLGPRDREIVREIEAREDLPDAAEVQREANEPSPGYPGWPARKSPFNVPMHD